MGQEFLDTVFGDMQNVPITKIGIDLDLSLDTLRFFGLSAGIEEPINAAFLSVHGLVLITDSGVYAVELNEVKFEEWK